MKSPSASRWGKRVIRVVAVGGTLIVLALALLNHWAAGERREAVERFRDAGNRIEVRELEVVLPPDKENFAMIPLLRKLRVENPAGEGESGKVSAAMRSMEPLVDGRLLRLPEEGSVIDLRLELEKLGLSGSAGEMLEQFDERHALVLEGLREGLDRPFSALPQGFDLADPRQIFGSEWRDFGSGEFLAATRGLCLRAELALSAGRGDVAFESVRMVRRLSDLSLSHGSMIGAVIASALDSLVERPLQLGLESGLWDSQKLRSLAELWARRDTVEEMKRILNTECVAMSVLLDHAKRDRSLWITLVGHESGAAMGWYGIPDAWFDLKCVDVLRWGGEWLHRFRTEARLALWWDAVETMKAWEPSPVDRMSDFTYFLSEHHPAILVRFGVRGMVRDAMVIIACQLELHRLREGRYPDELAELRGEAGLDPLNGEPFRYRRGGGGYLLYSIGPDGVDDGGVAAGEDRSDSPDWVWGEW